MMLESCDKVHPCGHFCHGFAGEPVCLPCLHEECVNQNPDLTLANNEDSYCSICYTSGLG